MKKLIIIKTLFLLLIVGVFLFVSNVNADTLIPYQLINLESGWNIISTPRVLSSHEFSVAETSDNLDIYLLDPDSVSGWQTMQEAGQTEFQPLYSYFINNKTGSNQTLKLKYNFNLSPDRRLFQRTLHAGWNAVGIALPEGILTNARINKYSTNIRKTLDLINESIVSWIDFTADQLSLYSVKIGDNWGVKSNLNSGDLDKLVTLKGYGAFIKETTDDYNGLQNINDGFEFSVVGSNTIGIDMDSEDEVFLTFQINSLYDININSLSFSYSSDTGDKDNISNFRLYDVDTNELLGSVDNIADDNSLEFSNLNISFNSEIRKIKLVVDVGLDVSEGDTYEFLLNSATLDNSVTVTGLPITWDVNVLITIPDGTLQVTRSNSIGEDNINVANDQYLGAFTFTSENEIINISQLVLTIASTGDPGNGGDAILNVELVDSNGNIVAGPTDPDRATGIVTWTDTFSVSLGATIYKVRGDLQTSADWASNDTVIVSFTPGAMTAIGEVTGNSITPSPSSAISGNTQTVKAASLTVTRNSTPADSNIIVGQKDLNLSSWRFDATDSGEDVRVTAIGFTGIGWAATNTNALTIYANGVAQSPINDALADSSTITSASSTFALSDPIIITKGTSVNVELHGDKDSVASDATENWGIQGNSITVYGVSTGNEVLENITSDDGPTLTSIPGGTLTIETSGNPASAIVLAGSTGNVFSNVKLTADYEDLRLDQLIVHVIDGNYDFSVSDNTNHYQDVTNVAIYDGTTLLAQSSIPSTNQYTFNFNAGDLTIPKDGYKTLTIKADMATVHKSTDNAPGTANADLIIGFDDVGGIKTTGLVSGSEINDASEIYQSSNSSAMVLRTSKPTVTLPSPSNSLGAATTLLNGTQVVYAYKVSADASGGDVLLYRNTFVFATSGDNMTITNVYIVDENGNTIKAVANPVSYDIDGNNEYYYTATFNNPDLAVYSGATDEAIKISAGTSKTFKVYAALTGVTANESLTTFLVGDTVYTSNSVNIDNIASSFGIPDGDLATDVNNFIWSDNWKQNSIEGTDGNNATTTAQWYNGHLVPGLGNVVSTTPYVLFSS